MFLLQKRGQLSCLELSWPGARAVFTTRSGGTSQGPYSALNLGLHVGDDPEAVLENRRRLAASMEREAASFTACQQVHGTLVAVVDRRHKGMGALDLESAIEGADGMITKEPVVLFAFFADCVPIWLYDPVQKAGGVIHAGWRGTAAGIVLEALAKMKSHFGSKPEDLYAAVGPSIGPCCYQVGEEVVRSLKELAEREQLSSDSISLSREGKWHADLAGFNCQLLQAEGVRKERIALCNLCTSCHSSLFFSHRRDGAKTGRMAAIFYLQEDENETKEKNN